MFSRVSCTRAMGQPVLRVEGLDAGDDLGPGIGGAAAGLLGLGGGDLALQIALAPERQRLRQQVLGIADARRRQRRVLRAVFRDVLQLDAQEGIGQGAGRADPLARRLRLQLCPRRRSGLPSRAMASSDSTLAPGGASPWAAAARPSSSAAMSGFIWPFRSG
jgi:hypothetical protein